MRKPKDQGGMGFRDLESFNKALLAKQLWRMVKNSDTLMARVFKARYFRNNDLWSAQVKTNASFVWRSLLWSKEVIQKGSIRRIGDGHDSLVFQDKWVDGLDGTLQQRGPVVSANMKVSELILETSVWDVAKLDLLFMPYEIQMILNTPIGEHGRKDELKWKYDNKGQFTVKSAYLLETGYYDSDPNMSAKGCKSWSKAVWSLSIPPKVRVFLWRAFSNLIPTSANLEQHHVPVDGICGLCHDRWDSTEHSLIFCPLVRNIWKKSSFWPIVKKGTGVELWDIGISVLRDKTKEEIELWAIMLWQVWSYVCRKMHDMGDVIEEVTEAGCRAIWEAYQAAKPTFTAAARLGVELGQKVWRRPRKEVFRVDVDVLFDKIANLFGIGIIIRDWKGDIKVAMAKRTTPSANTTTAEIMAVMHSIVFCIEQQVAPIEIYTDSILAARLMAEPEEADEFLPDDVRGIVEIARSFMLIGVYHMYRSANKAAHALAQFARNSLLPNIWTSGFPSWLTNIVLDDNFQ
ncbi:hypothetical protein OROMI_032309 [Orobanche minor]